MTIPLRTSISMTRPKLSVEAAKLLAGDIMILSPLRRKSCSPNRWLSGVGGSILVFGFTFVAVFPKPIHPLDLKVHLNTFLTEQKSYFAALIKELVIFPATALTSVKIGCERSLIK